MSETRKTEVWVDGHGWDPQGIMEVTYLSICPEGHDAGVGMKRPEEGSKLWCSKCQKYYEIEMVGHQVS